jgi:hypothetical protein
MNPARYLLLPWWIAQLPTGAKAFCDNPVIGSPTLNRWGLHVGRVRLAARIAAARRRRLRHMIGDADRLAFERDGFVLKRNFLPADHFIALREQVLDHSAPAREMVQGDTVTRRVALDRHALRAMPAVAALLSHPDWRGLNRYVGSFDSEPITYIQTILSQARPGAPDPQTQLHADTFHATVKAWLFLTDVAEDEGPFVYVPGSHRMTPERLAWERECHRLDWIQRRLVAHIPPGLTDPRGEAVAQAPQHLHAPLCDWSRAQWIEAGPGQKGVAAPIGPDFDPAGGADGRAARMEAGRVGDDQRIGRDCKGSWFRKAQLREFASIDAKGPTRREPVQSIARYDASAPFPFQSRAGHPVRTGDVSERAFVLGDIGQEQPGLHRWMECICVQLRLGVGVAGTGIRQDALDVTERLYIVAPRVADRAAPVRLSKERRRGGIGIQCRAFERNPAGYGISLNGLACGSSVAQDLIAQIFEGGKGQEIGTDDEAVAIERGAINIVEQRSQPCPAPAGGSRGCPHPGDVQAPTVEQRRSDDRIVAECLAAGENLGEPPGKEQIARRIHGVCVGQSGMACNSRAARLGGLAVGLSPPFVGIAVLGHHRLRPCDVLGRVDPCHYVGGRRDLHGQHRQAQF